MISKRYSTQNREELNKTHLRLVDQLQPTHQTAGELLCYWSCSAGWDYWRAKIHLPHLGQIQHTAREAHYQPIQSKWKKCCLYNLSHFKHFKYSTLKVKGNYNDIWVHPYIMYGKYIWIWYWHIYTYIWWSCMCVFVYHCVCVCVVSEYVCICVCVWVYVWQSVWLCICAYMLTCVWRKRVRDN